ncbi:hypothetical protein CORC01_10794 [Colletotrichum orchidophilum]|uniref:Uncharacterized protein n=1 Tax=Colletotrichum orchidophilum TaxID=1209926 RepID=A0A1G4AXQ3_9PEZI|nr:uncharacterized protein CORC01_10794 [Colletotrichum orchidophilum]OHE93895.1 hypothetical protein CORC01_10794 [Colletotrichum orchidophilum]
MSFTGAAAGPFSDVLRGSQNRLRRCRQADATDDRHPANHALQPFDGVRHTAFRIRSSDVLPHRGDGVYLPPKTLYIGGRCRRTPATATPKQAPKRAPSRPSRLEHTPRLSRRLRPWTCNASEMRPDTPRGSPHHEDARSWLRPRGCSGLRNTGAGRVSTAVLVWSWDVTPAGVWVDAPRAQTTTP